MQSSSQEIEAFFEETQSLIPKKSDRFVKSNYKDVWATILWLVFLVGFVGISISSIGHISLEISGLKNSSLSIDDGDNIDSFTISSTHIAGILLSSAAAGLVLSFAYFMALRRFAGKMITASLWISIGLHFVLAILFLVSYFTSKKTENFIAAVIFFLFGSIWVWAYSAWKVRIPFARIMLKTVTLVMTKYPATLTVAVAGLLAQTLFTCYWIVSIIGVAQWYVTEGISSGVATFLGIYMLFVFYWTSEIIKNTVHITVSGLFATFYYLGVAQPDGTIDVPVSNPTVQAAKRAFTTALGPNCYGSLLISIVAVIRLLLHYARKSAEQDGNIVCALFLCCFECLVACVENLLSYFNKYAFTQVAIYGKDFCTAGRDTWELIKSRGIDAIINDDLIANVLNLGGLAIGLITAFGGYLFVYFSTLPKTSLYYAVVCIVTFFIGLAEFSILSVVIDSGVSTTFVCLAEDPVSLAQKQPDLYQNIQRTYPQVVFF